jgi:hypothetical protein
MSYEVACKVCGVCEGMEQQGLAVAATWCSGNEGC